MNVPVSTPGGKETVAVRKAATLRAVDRCDRCGAQAYVEVSIPVVDFEVGPTIRATVDESDLPGAWAASDLSGGQDEIRRSLPLLFCAHHYREHEPALIQSGAAVTKDDRHLLQPRSSSGDVY